MCMCMSMHRAHLQGDGGEPDREGVVGPLIGAALMKTSLGMVAPLIYLSVCEVLVFLLNLYVFRKNQREGGNCSGRGLFDMSVIPPPDPPAAPVPKEATKTDAEEATVADVKLEVDGSNDLAQLRKQKATAAAKAVANP